MENDGSESKSTKEIPFTLAGHFARNREGKVLYKVKIEFEIGHL